MISLTGWGFSLAATSAEARAQQILYRFLHGCRSSNTIAGPFLVSGYKMHRVFRSS
jgi:hypothetical protein